MRSGKQYLVRAAKCYSERDVLLIKVSLLRLVRVKSAIWDLIKPFFRKFFGECENLFRKKGSHEKFQTPTNFLKRFSQENPNTNYLLKKSSRTQPNIN